MDRELIKKNELKGVMEVSQDIIIDCDNQLENDNLSFNEKKELYKAKGNACKTKLTAIKLSLDLQKNQIVPDEFVQELLRPSIYDRR